VRRVPEQEGLPRVVAPAWQLQEDLQLQQLQALQLRHLDFLDFLDFLDLLDPLGSRPSLDRGTSLASCRRSSSELLARAGTDRHPRQTVRARATQALVAHRLPALTTAITAAATDIVRAAIRARADIITILARRIVLAPPIITAFRIGRLRKRS